MNEILYRWRQKIKEKSMLYPGTRGLVHRKYLTMEGIKNWNELTLMDKLALNIKI